MREQLQELKRLFDDGLIDEADYRAAKQAILQSPGAGKSAPEHRPAATLVELLGPGMEVGPEDRLYRLERFLGEGGMGVVWLALDLEGGKLAGTDKRVALKFLPADVVGNLRDEQRLKQEAERAQQLGHPNIVRVWGWRRDPQLKLPFLEMEYLEGEDLNALLHREGDPGLTLERALELLTPVSEALRYAWEEHQLVHRDIKPGNVLVTKDGKVKLLDFGISAQARRTASSVGPSNRTPGYHAPEAAGRHAISPKLDAYSLGAVLYELLEGALPFDDRRGPHTPWPEQPRMLNGQQWEALKQALAFASVDRLESAWVLIQSITQGRGASPEEREVERLHQTEDATRKQKILLAIKLAERDERARKEKEIRERREAEESAKRQREAEEARRSKAEVTRRAQEERIHPGRIFRDADWAPEMVVLPRGRFLMGSPADEDDRSQDENSQHEVVIAYPLALGMYAVTNGEYRRFKPEYDSGEDFNDERQPVVNVSWEDAQDYIAWLNRQLGLEGRKDGYRLPSESEWEYGCRAGTTGPFSFAGLITSEKANYDATESYAGSPKGERRGKTVKVGSLPANPWGLFEMHGNVREWVEDCWHSNYRRPPTDGSAWTSGCIKGGRVHRGGSWFIVPWYLRSADRNWSAPASRNNGTGLRLARRVG